MVRKYSYELKKFIVTVLEIGLMSASELSRHLKIHKGVICKIYNRYKSLGDESLKYSYTRNNYPIDFKLKVLKYKSLNNLSYEETALHFNIPSPTAIYDWNNLCISLVGESMSSNKKASDKKVKAAKYIDSKEATLETSEEILHLKQRISELEKELYYKSAENAYLKKRRALMQENQ